MPVYRQFADEIDIVTLPNHYTRWAQSILVEGWRWGCTCFRIC